MTAVQWALDQQHTLFALRELGGIDDYEYFNRSSKILEEAMEMEKDNVCDAWDDGYDKGMRDRIEKISNPVGNAEQYYEQTFKSL
jgi:hypothetical protein